MQGTRKVEIRVRESGQFEKEGHKRLDRRRGGGKVFDSEQTAPNHSTETRECEQQTGRRKILENLIKGECEKEERTSRKGLEHLENSIALLERD